jgi:putative ABC transport system permease protein
MVSVPLRPRRLAPADVLRVGGSGLRSRRLRVFLSALGISLGIAAMIAVVGISSSSRAELDRQLSLLGTNLLTATPAQGRTDEPVRLAEEAIPRVARVGPVESVSAVGRVPANVYRNERISQAETGSIAVYATRTDLPATVDARPAVGRWLTGPAEDFPTVVLGWAAAQRLGIDSLDARPQVVIGDHRFAVLGILRPVPLATELDSAVFVGWPAARTYLGFDGHPTIIYTRAQEAAVLAVRGVLARTVAPESPNSVQVSRPSDALTAKALAENAFTGLLLGVGAVALLVGGIGVANTMVISVLERRSEIGLRRALGATQGQILLQFLVESLLLSALGGVGGVLIGVAVTTGYAANRSWPVVVPPWASAGGFAATLIIGMIAGLYPAVRAARLPPTEALAGS